MSVNTGYKNSVFSLLFSDPDVLRELYSALEGVPLDKETPITINTLSDVLYMERYNDISFTIGNKLVVLIEHQSTVNLNMPLKDAMKAAIEYCIGHNVLSKFLLERSSEVINMLLTEWNWTDAKEVWQQEAMTEGRVEERREIAKNALMKGYSIEAIQELTNLDPETIKSLS
ncbi:MAG: hypothetical protein LBK02_09250 [Treponema sp.]|jgi:hypothetical protein|nr:hypothetical protein [Treponema sp.]